MATKLSHHSCVIPADMDRWRLDKALAALAAQGDANLSRVRLQALIAEGHVKRNGKPITNVSRKVTTDETYEFSVPAVIAALPVAQKIPLTIVYEDNDVIVIDKPAGLVVHPAPGNRDQTLVNALLAHCGASLSGIGGVARPGIVHRLDKDTSGLMIVAKNDQAHQGLTRQFADRSLSRTYQAIVWGAPAPSSGDIDGSIGRHMRDRKKMSVTAKGKPALTHYKLIRAYGYPAPVASLVECKLATGRTHQIRVHMAWIHNPVLGDRTYGGRPARGASKPLPDLAAFPRQALHAIALQFIHPRTDKSMRFTVPLPKDMQALLKKLQRLDHAGT